MTAEVTARGGGLNIFSKTVEKGKPTKMLDNPEFKALPTQINHVLGLLKFLESASNASLDPLRAEIPNRRTLGKACHTRVIGS